MLPQIITAISSIAVAIIGGVFAVEQTKIKKQNEDSAKRSEQRKEESLLNMQLTQAMAELVKCMALNMIHEDYPACDIEDALKKLQDAQKNHDDYLKELGKVDTL